MSNTLTAADLDKLELLEAAATPGEWHYYERGSRLMGFDVNPVDCHADDMRGDRGMLEREEDAAFIAASRNAFRALLALARKGLECDEDRKTYLRVLAGMTGERDAQAAELAELRKACAALTPLIESVNRNKIPDQVPLGIDIERVGGSPTVGDLRRIDAAFALTLLSELEDKV